MPKIVIVGGVAGGMSAAARLRRIDEHAEIVVIEKGEYISYANCGLPYYIGNVINEREKLLVQTPQAFKARFNVDVRTLSEVVKVDRQNKKVVVRNVQSGRETTQNYDKLILSPGAEPIKPPLLGIEHPSIYTLRNIPDTDRIKNFVDVHKPRRVLIVGAGFIGLEMAENLRERGILVTIVEMANQVMNVIDFEMASVVHQHLQSKKIEFYLNDAVAKFEDANGRVNVHLKSGKEIKVDMVILSIGVKPDSHLAKEAGLKIGERGGIAVNEFLQTDDPDIYAIGDAIETKNPITGKYGVVPLAGPSNKQGRIVADNIVYGNRRKYNGTFATAVAKVFDLTVAVTGAPEKLLKANGIPYLSTIIHPNSHAGYYPDALPMVLKITFSPKDGKLYGAQAVGYDGVEKRIDVIAMGLLKGATVYDLEEFEHAYAPPYSSAKDPVNMIGFVAENLLENQLKQITWEEVDTLDRKETVLIDVRTKPEVQMGTIKDALHIPVDDLRDRLSEIPKNKKIVIFCRVGLRGYIAAKILLQNGYKDVYNLSGGYLTYSAAVGKQDNANVIGSEETDSGLKSVTPSVAHLNIAMPSKTIQVDACGIQCPGPIMKLKSAIDTAHVGDKIAITATDPGFANDIDAWVKATGNTLLSMHTEKGKIEVLIEKTAGKENAAVSSGNDKTIIVFDNDLDRVIASFIIANGAISMGRKVTMFFTFWGTSALRKSKTPKGLKKNLIEKMFGWMLPKGSKKLKLSQMNMLGMGSAMIRGLMVHKGVGTLEELIASAIQNGVKIVACQMSMDLMGLKKEELIEGVEIGGVASYLEASEHADNNLFI